MTSPAIFRRNPSGRELFSTQLSSPTDQTRRTCSVEGSEGNSVSKFLPVPSSRGLATTRRPASHDCRLHSPATTSAKAIRKTALGRLVHAGGESNLPCLDGLCGATVSTVQSVTHHNICKASAQPRDKFGLKRRLGGVFCRALPSLPQSPLRRACACVGFRPAQKRGFDGIHSCRDTQHRRPGGSQSRRSRRTSEVLAECSVPGVFPKGKRETGAPRGASYSLLAAPPPLLPTTASRTPSLRCDKHWQEWLAWELFPLLPSMV